MLRLIHIINIFINKLHGKLTFGQTKQNYSLVFKLVFAFGLTYPSNDLYGLHRLTSLVTSIKVIQKCLGIMFTSEVSSFQPFVHQTHLAVIQFL